MDEEDVEYPLLVVPDPASVTEYKSRVNLWHRFQAYLDGPRPRQPPKLLARFPAAQEYIHGFTSRLGSPRRVSLFWFLFYSIWSFSFLGLVHRSSFSAQTTGFDGAPPTFLSCTTTLWELKNGCGVDGIDCAPFEGTSIQFRCPANCRSEVILNNRPVGDQEIIHIPFVIGGQGETHNSSGIYRADSFVCASALHAGIVTDRSGGCGTLETRGLQTSFVTSERHGISSIPFDSEFPKSFSFSKLEALGGCTDLRWEITGVNALFTVIYSLVQTSPLMLYWILFIFTYFHVALVSDPPPSTSWELLGIAFEGFLPALFAGYAFWITAARWTLDKAPPLDRTIFWVGGLWFGALLEYISKYIPISRLLLSDIMRDGGLFWLIGLVVLLLAIVIGQMSIMRKSGDLVYYLKIYLTGLAVLIFLGFIPGLTLRIHHYIFSILFIPGTAYRTRLSMLYQGILVGLFLDGIGRWGFDSILETPDHLREDGLLNSAVPEFLAIANWLDAGYITWKGEPQLNYYYSLLVNEVERYRGPDTFVDPTNFGLGLQEDVPYYLRVAYTFGPQALDYTRAAILYANGTFLTTGSAAAQNIG